MKIEATFVHTLFIEVEKTCCGILRDLVRERNDVSFRQVMKAVLVAPSIPIGLNS